MLVMKYITFTLHHFLFLLVLTMPFAFLMACGVIVPVSQYKTVTIVKGGADTILIASDKQTTTDKAVSVMGCIFATYASSRNNKIISLPLQKKYHKIKVNFAWISQFSLEEKIAKVLETRIY